MIIGGGTISHYLIDILLREKKQVKVIDSDMQKLEHLSQTFPNVCAIYGDETDHEFLIDEGIKNFDSIVMLSDSDEENMVLSMFARSLTASKIVTKINRTLLLPIIEDYGVKSTVIPKKVIADIIIRVVRARINTRGSKMKTLHRLCENRVELIIFEIKKENYSKFYIEQFSLKQISQLCIFIPLIHKLIFYLVSSQYTFPLGYL